MEFTIKQSTLKDELGFIQGVVERKTTIPVLANILIESLGEKEVRIVGTDLDCTIRCDAEADIKETGAICIQARKLFDIVRALPANTDVHFKKEANEWVTMKCGNARFKLAGTAREQFPEIPTFKSTPLKLAAETFAQFIQNTAFAITNEQSRFTLSGAKFIIADGVAKMVTTDGHRLAYIEKQVSTGDTKLDTLVPKKALLELVKLSRAGDSDISFGEDPNHIFFEGEGRLLITRKLSGQFPNYEMVMPKDSPNRAVFDLEEMRNAVRRISLMADERNRSIRVTFTDGSVEITAQSSEEGEGSESFPVEYKGDNVTLGFNHQYLLEFLNNVGQMVTAPETASAAAAGESVPPAVAGGAVKSEQSSSTASAPMRIAFEFKDSNAATQMRIDGENAYDYKYIVMPLRI
jgi:DNA polymerase-3 subunit beta